MQVEKVKLSSLTLDPLNARVHNSRNLETIQSSLKRFGQQRPILVNAAGVVAAGNGTVMAAKALGWTEIDVVRTSLTPDELTAYALVDNRAAELANWDEVMLAKLLDDMDGKGDIKPETIGFSAKEADTLLTRLKEGTALKPMKISAPPKMSWALVGIPTARFGEIASLVEQIAAVTGTVVETTVTDDERARQGREVRE